MPQSNTTRVEIREARRKAGLCTMCGKRPPKGKGVVCEVCLGYYKKYKKKRSDKGLCPKCGKRPPTPGWKQCEPCLAYQRECNRKLRDEVFAAYGGYECNCCGETMPEFLQIDHVNNDGAEHRRQIKASGGIYSWLKRNGFPQGFQVLCANCNYAKGFYGYCPHKPLIDKEVTGVQRQGRQRSPSSPRCNPPPRSVGHQVR